MSRKNPTPWVGWAVKISASILWVFAMVAAYFWAHKPFGPALARTLSTILVWVGLSWLGMGLGRLVAGNVLSEEPPITRLALSAGTGLGLLSLLTLGLGLVGILRPVVTWGLVLVMGLILRRHLLASLVDLRAVKFPHPENRFERWLVVFAGLSLLLTLLTALAPPVGWDTLVYHLTGPRLFIEAGRVLHPFDLPYLGFPQLGEMLFTLGMLVAGEGMGPLLHFGYGLLALAVTASLARRAFGKNVALLATALLLSVPTLLSLLTRAYVSGMLLFYASAALYAFLRWREARTVQSAVDGRGWLLLIGLFCGFCGGVKYTAVGIPFALALSIAWASRRDGPRVAVGRVAIVALVAILAVLPWLLENWMTTGNPVYPFFLSGGVYWDEWRAEWYDRAGTGLAATAPWRLLTAPFEATILGTEGTSLYDASIGPLLLASAVLLIVVWQAVSRRERVTVRHMLLFFGVNYGLWLSGLARTALLRRTRFLFPVFGVVAVLGSVALDRMSSLRRPKLDTLWIVRAVVSLTLSLLLLSTVTRFVQINPLLVTIGLEDREDYLTRRLGWYYAAMQYVNRELPDDAVILFLWEPRSYHCQRTCWPDALLDRWLHTTHLHGHDPDAVVAAWQAEGVTHVLISRTGYQAVVEGKFDPVTEADQTTLASVLSSRMEFVANFGGTHELYKFPAEGDR